MAASCCDLFELSHLNLFERSVVVMEHASTTKGAYGMPALAAYG